MEEPEPLTQMELDQITLERQSHAAAKALLYEEGDYEKLNGENEDLRNLSSKGSRALTTSFVSKYLRVVADEISGKVLEEELCHSEGHERSQESLHELLPRITNNLDYEVMALIGLSNVVLGVQTGKENVPGDSKITRNIGTELQFEAFRIYVEKQHPDLMKYLVKKNFFDATTRSYKSIKGSIDVINDNVEVEWEWLSDNDVMRLGHFVKDIVFSATNCFEAQLAYGTNGHKQYAIVLSENGLTRKSSIMKATEEITRNNLPMIIPPKDHSPEGLDGGWLEPLPYPHNVLVRHSMGTRVSASGIKAINSLQRTRWQVNSFIYWVELGLIQTNCEIGSFRGFNNDLYDLVDNPLIIDPEDLRYSWTDQDLSDEEKTKRNRAYAISKIWESEKTLDKHKAINPRRVLAVAKQFLEQDFEGRRYDTFYLPWFMDNRTRCYPQVDTLNCQGSDYQKALMQFRDGVPKSVKSKKDLLISIATTYGNGIDKQSYLKRILWSRSIRTLMVGLVADPLSEGSIQFWSNADEPFQFLALCHEYVNVFIKRIWDEHRVSAGRDATCSGIQITGAMLRDSRTCSLVNVLPASEPQDAYKDVALEARKLLQDPEWMIEAYERNELNREKRATLWMAEFRERLNEPESKLTEENAPPPYEYISYEDSIENMDEWLPFIDRSVAKMPTMLIPYGGSFLTIFGHVKDKLKSKDAPIPNHIYPIIAKALVQGMNKSLPAFSAVNAWFQSLAKLTMDISKGNDEKASIKWETPNGSTVIQEYHNSTTTSVRTFLGTSSTTRAYNNSVDDYDSINSSKMRTALAANVVHSIDASIIQNTVNHITDTEGYTVEKIPFTAVHDCIYGPSGVMDILQTSVRKAFYDNIKEDITQHIAENNIPNYNPATSDLPSLERGDAKITLSTLLQSDYLFS